MVGMAPPMQVRPEVHHDPAAHPTRYSDPKRRQMNPNIEDIDEPTVIGTRVTDRNFDDHVWWLGEDGWWHCDCDGYFVDWSWAEVVEDIGPKSNNYSVVVP